MPSAHVCFCCGLSLARLRAAFEPHYGLPLVVCAGCGTPCVRRLVTIRAARRGWRALRRSLWLLAFNGLAALVLGSVVMFIVVELARSWSRIASARHLTMLFRTYDVSDYAKVVVPAAITGFWLALLGRGRQQWVWATWFAVLALALAFDPVIDHAVRGLVAYSFGEPSVRPRVEQWLEQVATLLIFMLIAMIGVPFARGVQTAWPAHRSSRWRRLMRRRRRWRSGG